eukprot:6188984-Pleurochrysis_carterae.AAC.2
MRVVENRVVERQTGGAFEETDHEAETQRQTSAPARKFDADPTHRQLNTLRVCLRWSRVVRKPRIRAAHVIVDLCTADGVVLAKTISKRSAHPMQYRQARKTALGEAWLWKQDEDAVEYLEDDFQ